MALVSLSFSAQAQSISLPYTDDFEYIEVGSSEASNSTMPVATTETIHNCSFVDKIYQAGGKIKFGSSKANGLFTTVEINPEDTKSITVEFDALSWVGKDCEVEITYGTQTQTVTVTKAEAWPVANDQLATYSVKFDAEDNQTLSFKSGISGDKRIFFDNLSIFDSVAAGIEDNLPSSSSIVGAEGMIIVDAKEASIIEVYNFAGKLVASKTISVGHNEIQIEQGMYIAKINGEVAKIAVQ